MVYIVTNTLRSHSLRRMLVRGSILSNLLFIELNRHSIPVFQVRLRLICLGLILFQSIVTFLDELLVDNRGLSPRLLWLSLSVVWNLNRLPIHYHSVVLIVRSVALRWVDRGKDVIALSILHILKLGFCIFCLDRKSLLWRSEIW